MISELFFSTIYIGHCIPVHIFSLDTYINRFGSSNLVAIQKKLVFLIAREPTLIIVDLPSPFSPLCPPCFFHFIPPFSFPRNSKKLWYNLFEAVCTRLGNLPPLCGTIRVRVYAMTCFWEQYLPEVLSFSIYSGIPGGATLLPFPFSNLNHSSLAPSVQLCLHLLYCFLESWLWTCTLPLQ